MGISERKAREREEREELILRHGSRLLLKEGFQELNLDELAKSIDYSKGTIYLHFKSKEDLALGIATRALQERAELFERAAAFKGKTRERMRAVGFACCEFAVRHRDYFNIEMMLKGTSFWEKASAERRRRHSLQAARTFRVGLSVVVEAIRAKDLPKLGLTPEQITFSLIAVTIGSHIMAAEPDLQVLAGIQDAIQAVRRNQDLMCDGLGWKPLLRDWDYGATDRRIQTEVFPEATWLKET